MGRQAKAAGAQAAGLLGVAMLLAGSGIQAQSSAAHTLGLPAIVEPADNPSTPAAVALGRQLFFDKRLSVDNTISCSTCHDPNHGFGDPHPVSVGVKGREGHRNSATVLNSAFVAPLMWDGRSASLEQQVLLAFSSPSEFDLPPEQAVLKLRRQGYSERFQKVFGQDVTLENIGRALAAYQRSLVAADSPFDRYLFKKDKTAISADAQRGFDVFLEAKCDQCHLIMTAGLHPFALKHVLFTDDKFHNLGVDAKLSSPDPGRFEVTAAPEDWGGFRTPSLRNVELTAPYFHDGSVASLLEVVEFYDKGGGANPRLDPALVPLKLSASQKQDLVRFLESLTSSRAADLALESHLSDEAIAP